MRVAFTRHRIDATRTQCAAVGGANALRHRVEGLQRKELVAQNVAGRFYDQAGTWDGRRPLSPGRPRSRDGLGGRTLEMADRWDLTEHNLGSTQLDLLP